MTGVAPFNVYLDLLMHNSLFLPNSCSSFISSNIHIVADVPTKSLMPLKTTQLIGSQLPSNIKHFWQVRSRTGDHDYQGQVPSQPSIPPGSPIAFSSDVNGGKCKTLFENARGDRLVG